LAAQSLGVVKIQQDGLIGLAGGFLGLEQIIQPANLYRHDRLLAATPGAADKVAGASSICGKNNHCRPESKVIPVNWLNWDKPPGEMAGIVTNMAGADCTGLGSCLSY
jgi:hypothetical protein